MKTITRSNVYLPMAAMILAAGACFPAAAQKQVPFKGVIQGQDKDTGVQTPRSWSLQPARELAPMSVNSHSPWKIP
jgi:hypothetical protein